MRLIRRDGTWQSLSLLSPSSFLTLMQELCMVSRLWLSANGFRLDIPFGPGDLVILLTSKGRRNKNYGYFTVRLTVRIDPPLYGHFFVKFL